MELKQEFESDMANKNEMHLKRPYFLMLLWKSFVLTKLLFKRNNIPTPKIKTAKTTIPFTPGY